MALVISNAAVLTLHWGLAGMGMSNVLGVSKPPGVVVNQALVNTVGAAIKTGYTTSGLSAQQPSGVGILSVGLRDISTEGQPEYLDEGILVAGIAVGDLLPPQTACVVSVRTGRAGGSYRGRVYLGGFVEQGNGPTGQISQAVADACVAFVDSVSDALSASGMQLAVLSRPHDEKVIPAKTIPAKTGFLTPATVVEVRNLLWDTQRRRGTIGGGSTLLAARAKRKLGLGN